MGDSNAVGDHNADPSISFGYRTACWVPRRRKTGLIDTLESFTDAKEKRPFIVLWDTDVGNCEQINNLSWLVLGRKEFLETMRVACGCFGLKKSCSECLVVESWAMTRLSRQMVRIQTRTNQIIMQIRGTNTSMLVRTNGQFLPTGEAQGSDGDWKGSISLELGSILTLGSAQQTKGLLEFELMFIDFDQAQKIPLHPHIISNKLNSIGSFGVDWSNPSMDLKPVNRTAPVCCEVNSVKQAKGHSLNIPHQATTCPLPLSITTDIAVASGKNVPLLTMPTAYKTTKMVSNTSYSVLFLQLGQSMPPFRVEVLEKIAREKGAMVVNNLSDHPRPTHLVLEGTLSASAVATKLGFLTGEDLAKTLHQRNMEAVTPDWIVCAGDNLGEPTMKQLWSERPSLDQRKRMRTKEDLLTRITRKSPSSREIIVSPTKSSNAVPHFKRNHGISELFQMLAKLHQDCPLGDQDEWKSYMFNLVAGRVRHLDFEISLDDDVLARVHATKGFGQGTMDKIKEYLLTGTCQRIHEFQNDPERAAMNIMMHIWGVGKIKARELVVNDGYKTIAQVREALNLGSLQLSRNQRIGIECWEEFREKMDRNEVRMIGSIVTSTVHEKFPDANVTIMGSYRRGKPTSGDIDILIIHPNFISHTPKGALDDLVEQLRKQGRISYHLSKVRTSNVVPTGIYHTSQSYMGVFVSPVHPGRRRRIDIKLYPYRERVFASLYFTGNGWFNRSMRLYAKRVKSISLNDHGIFPANAATNTPKPTDRLMLEANTEKDVFDYLGLEYKEVNERDCFDAVIPKSESGRNFISLEMSQGDLKRENHQWVD